MLNQENLAFIAVVEQGSFTKAAESLHTSKARVSQQVSRLEKQLGVTLLHRSTRTIRLTDAGETYFAETLRALNILKQAEKQLTEDLEDLSGKIRLNSVGGLFAEQMLAPAVVAFMNENPKVEVQLDFTSAKVDVISERYDLVVRMGKLEDSSLVARTLMMLGSNAVASPEYLNKHGLPSSPTDLQQHACLCGSVKRWQFEHCNTGEIQEVSVTGPFVSPNGHVLCEAALAGLGIIRLHDLYIQPHIKTGKLVPVLRDWKIADQPVSLVYPKARYKTRRIQVFVDFLVEWFA